MYYTAGLQFTVHFAAALTLARLPTHVTDNLGYWVLNPDLYFSKKKLVANVAYSIRQIYNLNCSHYKIFWKLHFLCVSVSVDNFKKRRKNVNGWLRQVHKFSRVFFVLHKLNIWYLKDVHASRFELWVIFKVCQC